MAPRSPKTAVEVRWEMVNVKRWQSIHRGPRRGLIEGVKTNFSDVVVVVIVGAEVLRGDSGTG